jgi:IMP dehydrogenase
VLKNNLLLSFDDVWLEPQYTEVPSRSKPDLESKLSPNVTLKHPVVASNMASVVGEKMMHTFDSTGSIAFLHRFMSREKLLMLAESPSTKSLNHFAFSVGIKDEDVLIAQEVYETLGEKAIILVDVAHAHSYKMSEFIKKIKSIGFSTIVAGNVATFEGALFLANCGVDSIRVGIAGGKVCTTKYVTGHHIPTLQSVIECSKVKNYFPNVSIIADGGISSSGDAVKAIAAGADFVCLGSVLASTSDSPGELIADGNISYKLHYGMSSKIAIDKFFGEKKSHVAPEGKSEKLHFTGETKEVLNEFLAGIRAGLSYSGAFNINEFQNKAILRHK